MGWRYYWNSNLIVWFVPTILWPLTLTGNKYIKYFFVNWFPFIYGPQWGALSSTAVWFMNAWKNKDIEVEKDPDTSEFEIIFTCIAFYFVGFLNIFLVLYFKADLYKWYP